MPGGGESGGMGAVNRVMIGPAGTVGLQVTSTTDYEERQQWGGRGGKGV